MSQDVPSLPQNNFLQFIDWRFHQLQHSLQMNLSRIQTDIDEKFHSLEGSLSHFLAEFSQLKENVLVNTEDIQELREDKNSILDRVEQLERKLETTEQDVKVLNLRFLGVSEHGWEDENMTAQVIVEVLNDHSSSPSWQQDDIARAFRIGRPRPPREEPRPVLVTFCHWSDKMAVLGDRDLRDSLRAYGIRVAADLTSRQRDMLDFHRGQGKIAYFHGGKLHVRDREQTGPFRNNQTEEGRPQPPARSRNSHDGNRRMWHSGDYQTKQQLESQFTQQGRRQVDNIQQDSADWVQNRAYNRISPARQYRDMWYGKPLRQAVPRDHSAINPRQASKPKESTNPSLWRSGRKDCVPVSPGMHSYSDAVRKDGPGVQYASKHRRIVTVKDTSSRSRAESLKETEKSNRHSNDWHKVSYHPVTPPREVEGIRSASTEEQPDETFDKSSHTGNNDIVDDCFDKEDMNRTGDHDKDKGRDGTSDDGSVLGDIGNTEELEQEAKSTNAIVEHAPDDREREVITDSQVTDCAEQGEINSKEDQHDGISSGDKTHVQSDHATPNRLTDRQDGVSACASEDEESGQTPNILSPSQSPRPRRTVSSSRVSRQAAKKTTARSCSQSSILDSFKKPESGCQPHNKGKAQKPLADHKKKGASCTNK